MLRRPIATSIVVFTLVSASRVASAQTDTAPPPVAPATAPTTETPPPPTPPVESAPPASTEAPPAGDTTTTTTVETTTPTTAPAANAEPPKEDDGVGFKWVYLVPEVGYSYVNLKSFSETDLALVDSSKSGAVVGAGAGVRIVFLTLGVRARHHFGMDMWQVLGEAGLHFKVNRIDPYLTIRGGYDTIGTNFSQAVGNATGDVKVDVHGFNFGAGVGLDYFVADNFTMGVEGSGDLLFLTRPPAPLPAGLTPQQKALIQSDPLYQKSGSSVGFGGVLAFRLGLHF